MNLGVRKLRNPCRSLRLMNNLEEPKPLILGKF